MGWDRVGQDRTGQTQIDTNADRAREREKDKKKRERKRYNKYTCMHVCNVM